MVNVLSIDEAEADEAACHMEHGISKHIVERFVEFAEFFKSCPSAGAEWVKGQGYKCAEHGRNNNNCKRCGNSCLQSVSPINEQDLT
jgi:DtxR family Mn-dependent transcriptional regulator